VDPVPDPLLLRKSGSAGDRTRDLCICSQKLWPLDHRGGLTIFYTRGKSTLLGVRTPNRPPLNQYAIPAVHSVSCSLLSLYSAYRNGFKCFTISHNSWFRHAVICIRSDVILRWWSWGLIGLVWTVQELPAAAEEDATSEQYRHFKQLR